MNAPSLAQLEARLRPLAVSTLPSSALVKMYSEGRIYFLKKFMSERCAPALVPQRLERICWGLNFRSPIFNAAGMFKNGEAYELTAAQGAGAYLCGTTTANARAGNSKDGTRLAFAPYPRSGAASNWLGLPNDGDRAVAARLKALKKVPGCPIGASLMGSPDLAGEERVQKLIDGLHCFADSGVDFLELNESCPNTADGKPQEGELRARLEMIAEQFLQKRRAHGKPPVIVKFSNDTELSQVPELVTLVVELGFDGLNFGNTSTNYAKHRAMIHSSEGKLFDYFTSTFGGGVSGRPLREGSLALIKRASEHLKSAPPAHEFHLIRTGGIETAEDVRASLEAGASLVEWFTAYFEQFSAHGHGLYSHLYDSL
ncbi:MAG: hypothetical protein U0136_01500 [Bdellovibrionota bacterium]